MIFIETKLKGSFIIELEKSEDRRGFFLRIWDKEIFEKHGLISNLVQSNISFNLIFHSIKRKEQCVVYIIKSILMKNQRWLCVLKEEYMMLL